MEVSYSIPTPKTLRKQSTRDDRLRIQTLYFDAGFTIDEIVLQLSVTLDQVRYALSHQLTPQKHVRGRKILLNTPQRKRLIEWVTSSNTNRRTQWADIPSALGWDCGEKAIRAAFKREGFVRRIARRKPPLTEQHRKDRLAWAWKHVFCTSSTVQHTLVTTENVFRLRISGTSNEDCLEVNDDCLAT
jgi:hypothetical protein